MIREVNLVSCLPPFMADYEEMNRTLKAEDPEFVLVWKAAERVLQNEFIATADEYGISRFEKMLKILPSREDTLESRRARVQSRWFTDLPYTWRMFLQKLKALCGEQNFTIEKRLDSYEIALNVRLEMSGQVQELERMTNMMFPCNLVLRADNQITADAEAELYIGGILSTCMIMEAEG